MKQRLKKYAAGAASVTMAAVLFLSQSAVGVSAAVRNTAKEEVVYVNLENDGSVSEVVVVNVFDTSGTITDYGEYTNIEVLNTTDEASYSGNTVTIENTSDGKLYYEGTMAEDTQIPWDISVTYIMDGTEYSADEIAGMSGELEIHIVIEENPDCEGDFFDTYALQMSVTLDTDLASDITADGATIANVGSDKQLTYTILAGSGGDYTITADVTDFEMDAIAINGLKLNLDVEVDDEELMDQISELVDAIAQIDDGAGELSEGVSEINDGVAEIQDALDMLKSQSSNLTGGSSQVLSALEQMQSALDTVSMSTDELSELVSASAQIQSGIDSLESAIETLQGNVSYSVYKAQMAQAGLDLDTLAAGNNTAIAALQTMLASLDTSAEDYAATYALYTQLIILLQGSNANITGIETYLSSLNTALGTALSGAQTLQSSYAQFVAAISTLTETISTLASSMPQLSDAVDTLVSEYETLDDGICDYTDGVSQIAAGYQSLVSGVETLLEGSEELSDGTGELRDETDGMDEEISDQIDELIESITGAGGDTASFVSSLNTNVDAVQFVIQTPAIEIEEAEAEETVEEESAGFIRKLLSLFGL